MVQATSQQKRIDNKFPPEDTNSKKHLTATTLKSVTATQGTWTK